MKRENWQKVKQIFNDALELEPSAREAFLAQSCQDDDELRRDVEILLNSFTDDFLEQPAVEQVADVIAENRVPFKTGDQIGAYKIVKTLGAGGQGTVYLAQDLTLNRQVAIKFLPTASSADEQAVKRFKREAQAAAALSHPAICVIHKIEEDADRTFLVMQYVEGETLAQKLKKGNLDLRLTIDSAVQIAAALAEAHGHGITHRDIKPSNIIISPAGQVTVLDFGLAKQTIQTNSDGLSSITKFGAIMGTAAYMSPEQSRGKTTDARTDIWSLGVCLYEMFAGKNPFLHESLAETFAAILSAEPNLDDFPPPLSEIIRKTLRKNTDERYQTADELLTALRELQNELKFKEMLDSHESESSGFRPSRAAPARIQSTGLKQIGAAGVIALILAVGGWFYFQNRNSNQARENIKKVAELAQNDRTFEAYELFLEIQKYLPNDENLVKLMPLVADNLSIKTEPAGARVFLRRFQPDKNGKFPEREFVGETPLENKQIARGQYLLFIEKEGFAPFMRSISGRLPNYTSDLIAQPPIEISAKLIETERVPERMIFVPGGEYRLVSYTRPTEKPVQLGDFLIDKYEVSNAEFKEFVTAGGYAKKEFWEFSFIKDGREIPFADAVREFKDRTGLPAPRSWTNQNFPESKAAFPVTDITWYEAAAYARFRGKDLPTIFQWEKAARDGKFDEGSDTMPWGLSRNADSLEFLANFRGENAVAVDSFEFGASPYGCLNMAGNVAEWMLNKRAENVLVSGGAWGDKSYLFGYYGDFPPSYNSNRIGLRLVKNLSENANGAGPLPTLEIPVYQASSDADFKNWLVHYAYDKTPLEAEIVERTETEAWTREKITFVGANREKAVAYLYLPKNFPRPLQIVHWIPAADVPLGFNSLAHSVEDFLMPVIKSGRAVFAVAVKGYSERPFLSGYEAPKGASVEFRKEIVSNITDWRRGFDYLETRPDLDKSKIAFLGLSHGANLGLILTAVERRYASLAFVGFGVRPAWKQWIPEANFINFAPHIAAPKLILKGRYDEAHPLKTEAEPIFKILREPRRILIVESGHVPPPEIFAPAVNEWFDETLGKTFD